MGKRAIVYTVDDNTECILQMVTSISSVRKFEDTHYDIYILTNKPRSWMEDMYGAKIVDVSQMVKDYGLDSTDMIWRKHPVPPMLMFRLLIPLVKELQEYDQILYLDTDTEVWNRQFFSIFSIDRACEVIGVKDSLSRRGTSIRMMSLLNRSNGFKDPAGVFNRWNELIYGNGKYANSGVLVFNMDVIRPGYEEKVGYVISAMKRLRPNYSDQDTLNAYYRVFVVDDRRYNNWGSDNPGTYLRHYVGNERRHHRDYPLVSYGRPNAVLDAPKKNPNMGILSGEVDMVYRLTDLGASKVMPIDRWLSSNKVKSIKKIDVAYTGRYDSLLDLVPHDDVDIRFLDGWIAHYKAIVDAIKSGYDKIAVFEDGLSTRGLDECLTNIGHDHDVVILSGAGSLFRRERYKASDSKGYILSRKGMVNLRQLYESLWFSDTEGRRLRYTYKWFRDKILTKERVLARS